VLRYDSCLTTHNYHFTLLLDGTTALVALIVRNKLYYSYPHLWLLGFYNFRILIFFNIGFIYLFPSRYVANVGDSRAVLIRDGTEVSSVFHFTFCCVSFVLRPNSYSSFVQVIHCCALSSFQAKALTKDHKPHLASERARIEAAGGKVVEDRSPSFPMLYSECYLISSYIFEPHFVLFLSHFLEEDLAMRLIIQYHFVCQNQWHTFHLTFYWRQHAKGMKTLKTHP
jgi:hypothetical protein